MAVPVSVLTGTATILIELANRAKFCNITRGSEHDGLYDAPTDYRKWTHPAEAIETEAKCERTEYMIEVYTDGSKSENGLASELQSSLRNT